MQFRIRATVDRLEQLGVAAADAKRFAGDDLFSGLSDRLGKA